MAPPLKVAVIGAGVAGLATARALKIEGHQVVVYEKSDKLGGTWAYDPKFEPDPLGIDPDREIVHSSLYHSLRTNLPRQLMGFPDYPFSTVKNGDARVFPCHEEVLEFLNEFATHYGLTELTRFGTEAVRVERVDLRSDRWVVESRNGESCSEEVFDAVVVCNGHHTQPRAADFSGRERWPGKQMHSHNYRVPDPFQDQIVVVVGDGTSAKDISLEISSVAKQVHLSSRSPNVKVSKLDCGDNMWQHSVIDHVSGNGEVAFLDGASVPADIILHCTGYIRRITLLYISYHRHSNTFILQLFDRFKYDFPFLKTEGIVTVEDNRVGPLYKHTFPPELAPNLSFVGLTYRSPIFAMIDLQAKWVAHVLSGKARLPSVEEMLAEVKQHYWHLEEKGIPKHHTHCLDHNFEYLDWVATQVGLAGVDEGVRTVYTSHLKFRTDNGDWRIREWELCDGIED